ncbi:carbohydrate-binding module family 48 protein [Aspergillus melleus]|uniref:carbohydrate-binding module family 48 protein n=1 Tax=Aspergillus melleus TaxID=138277 RepID=UPI001E8E2157|nr:Cruciform DNA binding protein [Aspergillus melleus]KAH8423906.1 Cruciform DNA binding protein [Aspergillus melleus]
MGSYTFRWPHDANEVYVTGTFDDWGKTVQLEKKGDFFEKEVHLSPTDEKLHYKFVVDGTWTTDTTAPEEDDGSNNINNVLYPDQIHEESQSILQNGAPVMAGVTPDSTTAALAGGVPKESSKHIVGDAAFSSAAPGSTTAELAKNAPFEQRANVPGTFPATPGLENVSINPIPASSGTGNPISLKPGEKVPHPSTFNSNTIQSTARTDQAGYEQDASHSLTGGQTKGVGESTAAAAAPPTSKTLIPESSLPMGEGSQGASDPVTIQSAAPTSTTAALAAGVPLESQKHQANGGVGSPASEVPDVVKDSLSKAHESPEAAAYKPAVEEKKDLESELQKVVPVEQSSGTPAPAVTAATTDKAPGATTDQAHKASAATTEEPPAATGPPIDTTQLSPRATTPTEGPTVTTGPEESAVPKEQGPGAQEQKDLPATPADQTKGNTGDKAAAANNTKMENASKGAENGAKDADKNGADKNSTGKEEKKKQNRVSGFFHKLKEKLK